MDRNSYGQFPLWSYPSSLSARRAWIEIARPTTGTPDQWALSARRAGIEITSDVSESESLAESLSARRAWIEIDISILSR